jgi:hypothetical protein
VSCWATNGILFGVTFFTAGILKFRFVSSFCWIKNSKNNRTSSFLSLILWLYSGENKVRSWVVVSKLLKKESEIVPMHAVKECKTSTTLVPRSAGLYGGRGGQDQPGDRINRQNLRIIAYIFTP